MKKLLASASILALSSAPVFAADLAVKAPPMVAPVHVFSWTGCYIGAHVGGGTSHDSFTSDNSWFLDNFSSDSSTGKGAVAGGQVGCNYQDGNAVFGLEGEGYWSGINASGGWARTGPLTGEGGSFAATSKNKDDFSIAVRFGLAFDRTLVYGKAGWVWGNFDFDSVGTSCTTCSIEAFHSSGTLDGLLLGVGVEHALTQNWIVKLEYNFLDFGSRGLSFTECFAPSGVACTSTNLSTGSNSNHSQKQIFKVGFNYLFNAWGAPPLVAKY